MPMKKTLSIVSRIALYSLPLFLMIALIPLSHNDYILAGVYFLFACIYLMVKPEKINALVYFVGLTAMTLFESIFLLTGVETFTSKTLFNIMPLWLPFLWAYGFLVIKDSLLVLLNRK